LFLLKWFDEPHLHKLHFEHLYPRQQGVNATPDLLLNCIASSSETSTVLSRQCCYLPRDCSRVPCYFFCSCLLTQPLGDVAPKHTLHALMLYSCNS
jgi:hypothetical protein